MYLHPFVDNMWNSPNIQIHPIVWEGREQGWGQDVGAQLICFYCFGLHVPILKTMCHDQHLCHQSGGRKKHKGRGEFDQAYCAWIQSFH